MTPKVSLRYSGIQSLELAPLVRSPGSGLWLAIVHTDATQHRGSWHIPSTKGQDTPVTVQMPLE